MDSARAVYAFDSRLVDGIVNGLATVSRGTSVVVGAVDKYLVDGIVNTIAAFIKRLMSPLFRAAQTGFTQNYALVMVLGLMIAVAIFFARDIATMLRQMFSS
jgi:NADH-quinone oxidoreductase subunit L